MERWNNFFNRPFEFGSNDQPDQDDDRDRRLVVLDDGTKDPNEDIQKRVTDLEILIKKLQVEIIDMMKECDKEKDYSSVVLTPSNVSMHNDMSNYDDQDEPDKFESIINNRTYFWKREETENTPSGEKNSSTQKSDSENEINRMIIELRTEINRKLNSLKNVKLDDEDTGRL